GRGRGGFRRQQRRPEEVIAVAAADASIYGAIGFERGAHTGAASLTGSSWKKEVEFKSNL
ncbi:unnamed protein product, partial [Musa textilis]